MTVHTANYHDVVQQLPAASTLVLNDVSWDEYEELLDAVGEAKGLRISYDAGRLQVMTLSSEHEKYSDLLQDLVRLVSLRLRIRVLSFGSATIKKRESHKGAEPDHCFYVQTSAAIGNKGDIDFNVDPPPDVVVEVDLQHQSLSKFPIYAGFGVPEIWRYDGETMMIYYLAQGEYFITPSSRALPMLSSDSLTRFLARSKREDQYETLLAFEDWLRAHQGEEN